jgi:hypothetical protein
MEGFAIAQEWQRSTQIEKIDRVVSEEIGKNTINSYLIYVETITDILPPFK